MIRRRSFILKVRARTYRRIVCILVAAALSSISVWVATSDKQTTVGDFTHKIAKNDMTTMQTTPPRFLSMYNYTHFNGRRKGSAKVSGTNFTAVILLTYMRSGSSFTGDILQQNADSFYVFEPFRALHHLIKTRKRLHWLNGTISLAATVDTTLVKRQALIGWMTCNFSMIYAQSFDDWYFLSFGKKTALYNDCIFRNYGIKDYYLGKTHPLIRMSAFRRGLSDSCLLDLQNACLASKFRIVKTIRTEMSLATDILNEIEESKVINLIRDPRATVISQARYHGCPGSRPSLSICAQWHCGKVWTDTLVKEEMLATKPERIFTVLYEHIVSYPTAMAEIMYKFLGMNISEKISNYARDIALGGNITGCTVCEQPWQTRNHSNIFLDGEDIFSKNRPAVLLYIQNVCKKVVEYYGYEFYNSSQIR